MKSSVGAAPSGAATSVGLRVLTIRRTSSSEGHSRPKILPRDSRCGRKLGRPRGDANARDGRVSNTDSMRQTFAHEALLAMESDADVGALGAAITKALCGHWEHQQPCPLAPHHSDATRVSDGVYLRVLFATEPDLEETVRRRIEAALSQGHLVGPEGDVVWRLTTSRCSEVTTDEVPHVERLKQG